MRKGLGWPIAVVASTPVSTFIDERQSCQSSCDDPLISGYTDYLHFLHNNQGLKNEKDPKNYPTFQI